MCQFNQYFVRFQWGGFFVEAGAYNGESLSNTLFLERYLNWTGILIEPNEEAFESLLTRQRKSFALPVCLPGRRPMPFSNKYVLYNSNFNSAL